MSLSEKLTGHPDTGGELTPQTESTTARNVVPMAAVIDDLGFTDITCPVVAVPAGDS